MTQDAVFGGTGPERAALRLQSGLLEALVADGELVGVRHDGVEVVRRIACKLRDANWATLATRTLTEDLTGGDAYRQEFRAGAIRGEVQYTLRDLGAGATELVALTRLQVDAPVVTNRAGFIILHPLRGVVGQPLVARHPDVGRTETLFPDLIRPSQPVFGIAGLSHVVDGVAVDIAMDGEVFAMEDHRNWSDASYKTYCRPLSAPRPYLLEPGQAVEQVLTMRFSGRAIRSLARTSTIQGKIPALALSAEAGSTQAEAAAPALAATGLSAMSLRLRADAAGRWPRDLGQHAGGVRILRLELVLPKGIEAAGAFAELAAACRQQGLSPAEVIALPEPYLTSHQPQGPWPTPPSPADLIAPLRAAFPGARVGAGMLTNFTELNRHPPPPGADFVTFGTTALVHAADDRSVLETLEALPDIFRSAQALAGGAPLRLGLMSVGMRSNPYGASVAENPDGERIAMAMSDPRQKGLFAAAFLTGLIARATAGGIEGLSPAMTDGPQGMGIEHGQAWPILHAIRHAATLAGRQAEVWVDRDDGLTGVVATDGRGMIANLGADTARLPAALSGRAVILSPETFAAALADPLWSDRAVPVTGNLPPFAVAFLQRPS